MYMEEDDGSRELEEKEEPGRGTPLPLPGPLLLPWLLGGKEEEALSLISSDMAFRRCCCCCCLARNSCLL